MPRTLTTAMKTAIAANCIFPAIFLDATFRTGPVYLWTGIGSITWNSHTYLGLGTLGGITPIEEGSTVSARNVTLTLSGIDPTWLSHVLTEFQINSPVIIRLGLFSGGSLVTDPVIAWAGKMDQPSIDVSAETAILSISCENRMLGLNQSNVRRYTNDDQQLDHPGDTAFAGVMGIQERTIYFGATPNSTNNL